eukprot:9463614-Ditylum_brightwellii.AAC.1
MPTIETVKTCHNKAVTMTYSVATVKNTQQSTSSVLMKKETKHQRRVLTEMAMGKTVTSMTVTATSMAVVAMLMTVVTTIMTDDGDSSHSKPCS